MMKKHLRSTAVVCYLALMAAPAFAGDSTIAWDSIDELLNTLFTSIDGWKSGSAKFNSLGQRIAVTLFGILFVWGMLKSWVAGKGLAHLVGDLVQPLVLLGVTLYAVNGNFGQIIADSTKSLAQGFAIGDVPPARTMTRTLMNGFADAGITILMAPTQDKPAAKQSGATQTSENSGGWTLESIGAAFVAKLAGPLLWLYGMLVRVLAMLALMVCAAIGAGMIIMAHLMMALGIVLAPVLIPWGMWTPTAFIFSGWVKFMITSGMQVVVTFAVGSLMSSVAQALAARMARDSGDMGAFALSAGLLLFSVLCIFMMLKVDSIAAGLLQGDGSMTMQKWSAGAVGAAKSGAAAAGSAVGAVGSSIEGARSAGAGLAHGAHAGTFSEATTAERTGPDGKPTAPATRTERVAAAVSYGLGKVVEGASAVGGSAHTAHSSAQSRIAALRARRSSKGAGTP